MHVAVTSSGEKMNTLRPLHIIYHLGESFITNALSIHLLLPPHCLVLSSPPLSDWSNSCQLWHESAFCLIPFNLSIIFSVLGTSRKMTCSIINKTQNKSEQPWSLLEYGLLYSLEE